MKHTESVRTKKFTYTALFEAAEEGGFVVSFPDVPGAVTQGETLAEARRMAAECLELHLEALLDAGQEPPESRRKASKSIVEDVTITLKSA